MALAAGLLLAAAVLTGCDDPPKKKLVEAGCLPSGVAMSLAIGARANSPTPALPELVEDLARSAARKHKGVSVVQVDGRPDVDLGPQVFDSKAENDNKYEKDLAGWLDGLRQYVAKMRADEPEADVLKALDVAAAQVGPGDTVVLVDSGLTDHRTVGLPHQGNAGRRSHRGGRVPPPVRSAAGPHRPARPAGRGGRHRAAAGGVGRGPATARGRALDRRRQGRRRPLRGTAESPNGTRSGIDSPPVSVVPVAAIPPFAPGQATPSCPMR